MVSQEGSIMIRADRREESGDSISRIFSDPSCRKGNGGVLNLLVFLGSEDALYKELWRACAGPFVTVPREGELAYYFPQGHIEQVS
ncbi:hypothetical protein CDL15_Pgr011628 [Punica granatum]|uniref:Auxin response factor domain-containing protein n=1 Tax=Punica granatum TaxID=22663 RepID=A0A218XH35_PUNGR|nr:hypothetical protein CDL15_Pgr011628 [Punica granatum]